MYFNHTCGCSVIFPLPYGLLVPPFRLARLPSADVTVLTAAAQYKYTPCKDVTLGKITVTYLSGMPIIDTVIARPWPYGPRRLVGTVQFASPGSGRVKPFLGRQAGLAVAYKTHISNSAANVVNSLRRWQRGQPSGHTRCRCHPPLGFEQPLLFLLVDTNLLVLLKVILGSLCSARLR